MPPSVTASSGFDALSHSIESYVCVVSTEFTEAMSLQAATLILGNLEKSYGNDKAAREKMHHAATLAEMAINNSALGFVHAMDHIGPQFGLPHGVSCAILLPLNMEFNVRFESAVRKYAKIAEIAGLGGRNERELAESLLKG